jgi:hypothetical protein
VVIQWAYSASPECHEGDRLLQDAAGTAFLELGAGKAYLACMLAEAFPARHLVLVDHQSFKLQADRWVSLVTRGEAASQSQLQRSVLQRPRANPHGPVRMALDGSHKWDIAFCAGDLLGMR